MARFGLARRCRLLLTFVFLALEFGVWTRCSLFCHLIFWRARRRAAFVARRLADPSCSSLVYLTHASLLACSQRHFSSLLHATSSSLVLALSHSSSYHMADLLLCSILTSLHRKMTTATLGLISTSLKMTTAWMKLISTSLHWRMQTVMHLFFYCTQCI